MKRILSKKIPLTYVIGLFTIVVVLTIFGMRWLNQSQSPTETAGIGHSCSLKIKRLNGYQLIKPIMFADEECPSENLNAINQSISSIINSYKQYQNVTAASVYLRNYETSEWTSVNENENYEPGSLFKVPLLVATLKMSENKPGLLDKKVAYNKPFQLNKSTHFLSKSLQVGQTYTIRELLNYMIVHSDNNATALLQNNIDLNYLIQTFSDLGLPKPDIKASQYFFTVNGYSLFMRAIYNATYLNTENSNYAAKLLSQSTFKEGIVSGLPSGTPIAHKFGEAGNPNEIQLHESAIVYLDGKAYLLTVMTKGKEFITLAKLIAEISKAVYDSQKSEPLSSL